MIICRTPYRISFFGGGSDYPVHYKNHGGAVLATSINKYCYVTLRHLPPFFEHKNHIVYSKIEFSKTLDDIQHPVVRECLKYVVEKDGVEVHHDGDLPARAGMGTSSSFTVCLLNSLYALKGIRAPARKLALDAIIIEQNIIGENVGSQDQVTAAYGGFNKIEFNKDYEFQTTPVTSHHIKDLNNHMMLFFTGFSRTASDIAAEQIKQSPKKKEDIDTLTNMVDEGIDLLHAGDIIQFGNLMHRAWMIKRTITNQITTDQIDRYYNAGMKAGAWGGKLLGAGGGGFLLFVVEPEKQDAVKKAMWPMLHVPFKFENQGSRIIYHTMEE
jgi:D-glycero-alpha-D-manno-heptose-7-phosphate kinase